MTESRYELSIRELGYQLPEVAAPVAAYCTRCGERELCVYLRAASIRQRSAACHR